MIEIGDIVRSNFLLREEKEGLIIDKYTINSKDEWATILWFNTPNIVQGSYPIRKLDKIS